MGIWGLTQINSQSLDMNMIIGNRLKESYFGADDKLINEKNKVAVRQFKYDLQNRKTEETLYDHNYQLISNDACIIKWKYDENDNIIEESHFGIDQKLKESKNGTAIIRWKYDPEGNLIKTLCFNSHEELISEK